MFCTQCGFNNRDGAKFCKSCGKPLDASRVQNDSQKPVQKSMQQYVQSGREQAPQTVAKPVGKAAGKAAKKAGATAGGGFLKKVILVAAAVTVGGVVISQFGDDGGGGTPTPTTGSTISIGTTTTGSSNTGSTTSTNGNNTGLNNSVSRGVPAGEYVYNSANLYFGDDVDREALYSAFKELKLNIGSDGSFSGSGVFEIPLNDYKKEVTEETEHNDGSVYEYSVIGSVKAEVFVEGIVDSNGNGSCSISFIVNHDYDKEEVQQSSFNSLKDITRRGISEHFRYEYTGSGRVDTPNPNLFKTNGVILHPDGELSRTGESYEFYGPDYHEGYSGGSIESKNVEQKKIYTETEPEYLDLGFMIAWSDPEETSRYVISGTKAPTINVFGN